MFGKLYEFKFFKIVKRGENKSFNFSLAVQQILHIDEAAASDNSFTYRLRSKNSKATTEKYITNNETSINQLQLTIFLILLT